MAQRHPDSKVHGANMGPTWVRQVPGGPHVGPMNFAIWVVTYWISRPYLRRHLLNMKVIQKILTSIFFFCEIKDFLKGEIKERRYDNPHPILRYYDLFTGICVSSKCILFICRSSLPVDIMRYIISMYPAYIDHLHMYRGLKKQEPVMNTNVYQNRYQMVHTVEQYWLRKCCQNRRNSTSRIKTKFSWARGCFPRNDWQQWFGPEPAYGTYIMSKHKKID